jgi:hypothetical protein
VVAPIPDSALPPNLMEEVEINGVRVVRSKRHADYPWGLRWIPRGWTAFKWGAPRQVLGNQKHGTLASYPGWDPKPIGEPGTWQLSRFPDGPWYAWYFAFTTKGGTHFRIGARWDDVDSYTEFPSIAIKRVPLK